MKIKAFSFERNSFAFADVKRTVLDEFIDGGLYFESISDPNVLFSELRDSLDTAEVILIGVETSLYLKFKPILIKAFGFTPAYSDAIDSAMGDSVSDEKIRKAHMLVPNESVELVSKDGLYSGFYMKSDNQYIVVIPLNKDVVPGILKVSGLPFIAGSEKKEDVLESIAVSTGASLKAKELVKKLSENGIKLSIPSTPASQTLKDDIKAVPGYEDFIFFTPFVNDTGVTDPKEYSAQLSRGAMELRSADMGATISNIFQEKSGDEIKSYYSFISVAISDKAVVRKLYADANETVDNLITEATCELYTLIDKYLNEVIFKKNATFDELEKYEQSLIEAEYKADVRPTASISKKGAIITISVLSLAVILCVVLGFKFGGYFISSSDEPEANSLQDAGTSAKPLLPPNNPFTTVTEGTTESIIDYTSESATSPFDVTATTAIPIVLPNNIGTTKNNNNNYNYNNNDDDDDDDTTKKPTTTKAPTTTKKVVNEGSVTNSMG